MSMILSFILWVLIGIVTSYMASKRGRDPFAWFAIGIFLGLLGLLLLVLLPSLDETKETEKENPTVLVVTPEVLYPVEDYLTKDWFYIDKNFQQMGPIEFEALKGLWNENKIDAKSFVWYDGMPEWKKVDVLPELQKQLAEIKT